MYHLCEDSKRNQQCTCVHQTLAMLPIILHHTRIIIEEARCISDHVTEYVSKIFPPSIHYDAYKDSHTRTKLKMKSNL
jgi:hypothetical protein